MYKEEERRKLFAMIWTLKESYVKCIGVGRQIPFEKITFSINKEKILFYKEGILYDTYIFKVDELDKGHFTAICPNVYDKFQYFQGSKSGNYYG